ncbi:site-specific tyrosine recombinase XerD [Streptococcus loxodontisalivarius]|uniref:Tyrosine recombinase XerD-like n=1 Tax=Streptococcus loxodontisalivarius TaxID=1349415 RepID=A0ABS2PR32_9STRE|nr:site-specific tyrosine recombinase XerD [Streptococcus loxodontisalivarius]MBM7642371.1 integrase [Streptococcus loxodontisalivarius]
MTSSKKDKLSPQIEAFLASKELSHNSEKSYGYDLQQFLDQVQGEITQTRLQLYQEFLKSLKPSASKRKLSAVNQFLLYLYQSGSLDSFHRLFLDIKLDKLEKNYDLLDLTSLYEETEQKEGQLIALLILELGLTPSEIAQLQSQDINLDFKVVTCQTKKSRRVLSISDSLLPYFDLAFGETFLFQNGQETYSRQWYFRRLSAFLAEKNLSDLTAQKLREQFIIRKVAEGMTIFELAKALGLKTSLSLENYFKN